MHTVCIDLADWDATRKAVEDIGAIDLLVNNAAKGGPVHILELSHEIFDQ